MNAEYEELKAACEKGETYYRQECSNAGKIKGVTDSIRLEMQSIEKQLTEDKQLYRKLLEKIQPT